MRGVHDHLQPGLPDPGGVHRPQQVARVGVEDAGREGQVPDLAGEGPPVLLARVDAVELALPGLGQVRPALVEEEDVQRVRHSRRGPQEDPARTPPRRVLPGHRHRHVLQVPDVDRGGLKPRNHRPFERTRTTRVVTRNGDGGPLLQGRRVGARQPDGQFRGDLDVQDPRDAAEPEEVLLAARLPDHRGVDDGAGLDGLERIDPDVRPDDRLLADQALVPDHRPVLDPRGPHHIGVLPDHAAAQIALRPDVHVVVHHRLVQERAPLDDHVAAQHRVLADLDAGFDLGVVPDVQRAAEHRLGVHLGTLGDPDTGRDLEPVELDVDLALQDVRLGLAVALVGAHVLPVALGDVAVDPLALLQQLREDIARPVDGLTRRDVVEDLGLHHVDTGVHRVGEDLPPGRLLQESLDPPFLVRDRDTELQWIRHPGETDGDQSVLAAVKVDQFGEVEVGQRVTGDHQEGVVLERVLGVLDTPRSAQWRLLVGIGQMHAQLFAVTEVVLDQRRQELDCHDGVGEAVPLQQPKHVLHDRPVGDRKQRLRHAGGHRAESSALAPCHYNGFHYGCVLLRGGGPAGPSKRSRGFSTRKISSDAPMERGASLRSRLRLRTPSPPGPP